MMQTDVLSAALNLNDSISSRVRLKGILVSSDDAGEVELVNYGTSDILFAFYPAVAGSVYVAIPGEGVLFPNGLTVSSLSNTSITAFYG